MRRFQHFKTLFCRSLLLSNMQICYHRRKYKAKSDCETNLAIAHPYPHLGMGNSQIRFTENFVFSLLKGFTTIWEGSTTFKLYSVEVCFYQTSRFVTLEENIRQKRSFLGFLKQYFWFVFALSFHLGYLKLL